MFNYKLQEISDLMSGGDDETKKTEEVLDNENSSSVDESEQTAPAYDVDMAMIAEFKRRRFNLTRQKKREQAIQIVVSENKMMAVMVVSSDFDTTNPITKLEILEKIKASGVAYGIIENVIDRFVRRPSFDTELLIARGLEKVDGVDGYFTIAFDTHKKEKSNQEDVDNKAKINLYEAMNETVSATKGQILGIITPNVQRRDGIDVYGRTERGKNSRPTLVKFEDNVYVDEKNQAIAMVAGEIHWNGRSLSISEVLRVSEVNVKTGNIRFGGSVIVDGNVFDGFSIVCDGDIYVKGQVLSAKLTSGGNITVDRGIHGKRSSACVITALGKVTSKFVEQATIDCYGDLVTAELINSNAIVRGDVRVTAGAGKIIGGECVCCGDVVSNTIGNSANILTKITLIGKKGLEEERDLLKNDIQGLTLNISKIWQNSKIQILKTQNKTYKAAIEEKTRIDVAQIEEELSRKEQSYTQICKLVAKHKEYGYISTINEMYEEVCISISDLKYITMRQYRRTRFCLKGDQISRFSIT